MSANIQNDPFEQINFKVPRGTKVRIKRLALDQGGIGMCSLFMHMLDEYERRRRTAKETQFDYLTGKAT